MHATSVLLLLPLVAPQVAALNSLSNVISGATSFFADLSETVSNGNYKFTNVANGKTLSFVREGSLTNVYPQSGGDALEVQFKSSMVRLSGGNNKCISAQWNVGSNPGYDHAAVSYACAVGSGTSGSATLEKTKQWWYLVPAGTVPSSTLLQLTGSSKYTASVGGISFSSKSGKTSSWSSSSSSKCKKKGAWLAKHPQYIVSNNHPECLSTLTKYVGHSCRKSGAWLNKHSSYLKKYSHPECVPVLASYKKSLRRLRRRSAHSYRHVQALEKRLEHQEEKRGSSTAYYIVARDHVSDMTPRAISNSKVSTYGGYSSTTLVEWDPNDTAQMWYITEE